MPILLQSLILADSTSHYFESVSSFTYYPPFIVKKLLTQLPKMCKLEQYGSSEVHVFFLILSLIYHQSSLFSTMIQLRLRLGLLRKFSFHAMLFKSAMFDIQAYLA